MKGLSQAEQTKERVPICRLADRLLEGNPLTSPNFRDGHFDRSNEMIETPPSSTRSDERGGVAGLPRMRQPTLSTTHGHHGTRWRRRQTTTPRHGTTDSNDRPPSTWGGRYPPARHPVRPSMPGGSTEADPSLLSVEPKWEFASSSTSAKNASARSARYDRGSFGRPKRWEAWLLSDSTSNLSGSSSASLTCCRTAAAPPRERSAPLQVPIHHPPAASCGDTQDGGGCSC